MSLPAYLAPTASTRSKYQPKRTPTSSDHESSSSLVRRTSTSIKQLVNAATRTHHNHHGPEQTQSHSKRQPISSSTTPAVTTAKTTTTTQGRSSLESGKSHWLTAQLSACICHFGVTRAAILYLIGAGLLTFSGQQLRRRSSSLLPHRPPQQQRRRRPTRIPPRIRLLHFVSSPHRINLLNALLPPLAQPRKQMYLVYPTPLTPPGVCSPNRLLSSPASLVVRSQNIQNLHRNQRTRPPLFLSSLR